jgi:hypothetical protein
MFFKSFLKEKCRFPFFNNELMLDWCNSRLYACISTALKRWLSFLFLIKSVFWSIRAEFHSFTISFEVISLFFCIEIPWDKYVLQRLRRIWKLSSNMFWCHYCIVKKIWLYYYRARCLRFWTQWSHRLCKIRSTLLFIC